MRISFKKSRGGSPGLKVHQSVLCFVARVFDKVRRKIAFDLASSTKSDNTDIVRGVGELEQVLEGLGYDFQNFDLDDFVRFIEEYMGCQIYLFPIQMPTDTHGAWIGDAEQPNEYIFYRNQLPPFQVTHTIIHELSHLILGHPTARVTLSELRQIIAHHQFLPDTAALRSYRTSTYEQEAETLAALIQIRTNRILESPDSSPASEATKLLASIGLD